MKLVAVTTKSGKNFTVGMQPVHDPTLTVEKITYHREGNIYNKGYQTGVPGYSIAMVDNPVRRLIPEHEVSEVWIDTTKEDKKKKPEETPEMEAFLAETEDEQDGA